MAVSGDCVEKPLSLDPRAHRESLLADKQCSLARSCILRDFFGTGSLGRRSGTTQSRDVVYLGVEGRVSRGCASRRATSRRCPFMRLQGQRPSAALSKKNSAERLVSPLDLETAPLRPEEGTPFAKFRQPRDDAAAAPVAARHPFIDLRSQRLSAALSIQIQCLSGKYMQSYLRKFTFRLNQQRNSLRSGRFRRP